MSSQITIARPYAKAVFEFAAKEKRIAEWREFLYTMAWITEQPKVQQVFRDPRFTADQCYRWILDVYAELSQGHEQEKNFLQLLASRKRLMILPQVFELFEAHRVEQEKIISVEVTSIFPLNASEQQHLIQALKRRLHRDVMLDYRLDSSIIGGLVIKAGDLVIDGSVRSKLARLANELTN